MTWREELKRLFPEARLDEPLSKHTTFRIGGPADAYLVARSTEELERLYAFLKGKDVPVFLLGWGSNLLVRDGGVRGLVLRLRGDFERVGFPEDGVVRAGAGVRLPTLVMKCAARGLAGTEPLVGVPGTVGGALVMNAGTREGEIGALVREVEVFDPKALKTALVPRRMLRFEYRRSNLDGRILIGASLQLKHGDKVDIIERVRNFQNKRQKTQPIHSYNVGSIFKNPPGKFVAQLIEEAGLKGMTLGGARVSPLHANFIENDRRATAEDVLRLVETVRERIRERTGIELELEMKVVGEKAPSPA